MRNIVDDRYFTIRLINYQVKYNYMTPQVVFKDQLSVVFSALAHPARRTMLQQLRHGKATVAELAEPLDISAPAITKHLKVLEKAGLIDRSRDAQWRYSELEANPLKTARDWLEDYREFWEEKFDRLETYVLEKEEEEKDNE